MLLLVPSHSISRYDLSQPLHSSLSHSQLSPISSASASTSSTTSSTSIASRRLPSSRSFGLFPLDAANVWYRSIPYSDPTRTDQPCPPNDLRRCGSRMVASFWTKNRARRESREGMEREALEVGRCGRSLPSGKSRRRRSPEPFLGGTERVHAGGKGGREREERGGSKAFGSCLPPEAYPDTNFYLSFDVRPVSISSYWIIRVDSDLDSVQARPLFRFDICATLLDTDSSPQERTEGKVPTRQEDRPPPDHERSTGPRTVRTPQRCSTKECVLTSLSIVPVPGTCSKSDACPVLLPGAVGFKDAHRALYPLYHRLDQKEIPHATFGDLDAALPELFSGAWTTIEQRLLEKRVAKLEGLTKNEKAMLKLVALHS